MNASSKIISSHCAYWHFEPLGLLQSDMNYISTKMSVTKSYENIDAPSEMIFIPL